MNEGFVGTEVVRARATANDNCKTKQRSNPNREQALPLQFSRVMLRGNAKRTAGSDLASCAEITATLDGKTEPSSVRGDRRRRYH
jgi:hypothetical protein